MNLQEKQRIKRILENARKEKNKEKKGSTTLTKQEMAQIIESDTKLQKLGIKIG